MIDLYLDRGTMFVLEDDGIVKGECVVTDEGQGVLEIQNLAITQEYQGNGYGKTLIEFVADHYREQYKVLQVGTGDSPLTMLLLCYVLMQTAMIQKSRSSSPSGI